MFLWLIAGPLHAEQRYAFQQQRAVVTVPDGWRLDPGPARMVANVIFAAKDASGDRTLLLMAMPLKEKFGIETEGLAESVEEGIAGHASIRSVDEREIQGVDAKLITAEENRGGTSRTLATAANGYLYVLSIYSRTGDAAADPEIERIVSSFDFVGLPEVDYVATEPEGFYAWGYRVGGIIFFILVAGAAGFWLGRRRQRSAPAPPKDPSA